MTQVSLAPAWYNGTGEPALHIADMQVWHAVIDMYFNPRSIKGGIDKNAARMWIPSKVQIYS